ncbi:MFS transporter [Propionicicella superfundia]|uniref:MFS transporter n=1 Tax=Propionicicella superfundia TaxID=348582 RepID=UPI00040F2019|nr:MFS transporter [Propionicicella superfundia]
MTTTPVHPGIPSAEAEREPKGYILKYGLASYGLFLAILTPVLGGLSIKLQTLNNGDLEAAASQLALVTGIGALFALVAQPLVGRLSDRTTAAMGMRKPWILAGVIGSAACLITIGFATNLATILVAWCLAQVFSNFAQAAETATIPDQVPAQRRGIVSGIVGACTPLAILTGAVGLAAFGSDALRFTVPAVIGLVLGLWFALTLRDRVLREKPAERLSVKEFFTSFVFNPRAFPDLGWAWLTKFMVMFGYASIGTYLTLFLGAKFGMSTAEQAQFNMFANIAMVAAMSAMSLIGGRLSDRVGKRRVFVTVGAIIAGIGIAVMAISPFFGSAGLGVILFAEVVIGAGVGLFLAVDMALCTEVLPNPEDTAKDLGVLNIANALPQSLAPMLAGPIIVAAGGAGYTVWFGIGALVAVAGGILVYRIKGVK